MEYDIDIETIEQTKQLGIAIGQALTSGMVITLEGDLAAGKTTLTQAIAKGLGVERIVNSPTFSIVKQYQGRLPLTHMDAYRLGAEGLEAFEDLFDGEAVVIIEWASKILPLIPQAHLAMTLGFKSGRRHIMIKPIGTAYEALCKEVVCTH